MPLARAEDGEAQEPGLPPAPTSAPQRFHHLWTAFAYALPAVPFTMLAVPALSIVPPIYAKHGALGLTAVSLVLLVARSFDALVDPVIGLLADRTRRQVGHRGWVLLSIPAAMLAGHFWLQVDGDAGLAHFLGWSMVLCLAWSLFEIPHRALLAEMASTPRMQATLAAWRTGLSRLGILACLTILQFAGETPLVTPATLQVLAAFVVPLLAVSAIIFHLGTGRHARPSTGGPASPGYDSRDGIWPWGRMGLLAGNLAARRVLSIACLQGAASGMTSALYFLYMDNVLGIARHIPLIALVAAATAIAGAWVWLPLITRIGRARTLAVGHLALAPMVLAFCLIGPGDHAAVAVMLIFMASALFTAGMETATVSLGVAVVRHHQAATGHNLSASFFSIERFLHQIGMAAGAALATLLVGLAGFRPQGASGTLATLAFFGMFSVAPALLHLAASRQASLLSRTAGSDLHL